jgi:hypothetical protein
LLQRGEDVADVRRGEACSEEVATAPRHRILHRPRPVGLEQIDPSGAEPQPRARRRQAVDLVLALDLGTEQTAPRGGDRAPLGHRQHHPIDPRQHQPHAIDCRTIAVVASSMDLDDTLMAVMAHGLLTSMSVVTASIGLLRDAWEDIDVDERDTLLRKAEEQALHVGAVLTDLVRGLPAEVITQLDHLRDD